MKLLHLIASTDPKSGGPIEGVRQLAPVMKEMGVEVSVACCDAPESPWLSELPFEAFALGSQRGGYAYSDRLKPWLEANIQQFDAIVADGIWQYTSFVARQVALKYDRPYFVFTHGMLDPWFKKTYPLKHLKKMLYWPLGEYRVLRDASATVFTCEEERILARQSFRMYRATERVVGYGTSGPTVPADQATRSFYDAFPELASKRTILFLSRIHEKKGCDLLIQAFAHEAARDPRLHLVMAGPEQPGLGDELRQLAKQLGVEDRISWVGMIAGDVKWGAFFSCEVFALTSHQENFGIVVAEALACRKPVLISDKVNIWREIQAEAAGFVGADDTAGARKVLSEWLDLSDSEKVEMGARARKCFESHFEIRQAARNLLAVIQEFSGGARSRNSD